MSLRSIKENPNCFLCVQFVTYRNYNSSVEKVLNGIKSEREVKVVRLSKLVCGTQIKK